MGITGKEKAISIKNLYPKHKIIGSDQILVCRDQIVSKPKNEEEAIRNLMLLQNNVHILVSAVSVIFGDKIFYETVKVAKLFFRSTTESEIKKYIQKNKTAVFSSVGSYRIEDNKNCLWNEITTEFFPDNLNMKAWFSYSEDKGYP